MIIIHKEVFFVNDDVSSLKKVKLRKIKLKTKHLVGSSMGHYLRKLQPFKIKSVFFVRFKFRKQIRNQHKILRRTVFLKKFKSNIFIIHAGDVEITSIGPFRSILEDWRQNDNIHIHKLYKISP